MRASGLPNRRRRLPKRYLTKFCLHHRSSHQLTSLNPSPSISYHRHLQPLQQATRQNPMATGFTMYTPLDPPLIPLTKHSRFIKCRIQQTLSRTPVHAHRRPHPARMTIILPHSQTLRSSVSWRGSTAVPTSSQWERSTDSSMTSSSLQMSNWKTLWGFGHSGKPSD